MAKKKDYEGKGHEKRESKSEERKEERAEQARGSSLNEIFIKDQVLKMQGSRVLSRRPRKKGEGRDNSKTLNNLWNKK